MYLHMLYLIHQLNQINLKVVKNMRNKMVKLAKQLRTMYLTENPVNEDSENYGYRYFICFHNTHTVVARTKSIAEMIEVLQDIIENGASSGNGTFY